jgi:hypothetical protein
MPQMTKLVVVVFCVTVLAVTGCGAGEGAEGNQPQREQQGGSPQDKPVSGMFVGKVPSTDAIFAVVAEKPKGGGSEREVSAYLSDGRQLSEGFTTTTDANRIRVSSQNKMNLVATISPSSTTGTITPGKGDASEGASYRFDIPPATDVDGYYRVMVPEAEGSLSATSWSGAQLEGMRSGPRISAEITPPGGGGMKPLHLEFSAPTLLAGENRWIVLQEGNGRLRIKGARQTSTSSGLIDPTIQLTKPGFIDLTTNT